MKLYRIFYHELDSKEPANLKWVSSEQKAKNVCMICKRFARKMKVTTDILCYAPYDLKPSKPALIEFLNTHCIPLHQRIDTAAMATFIAQKEEKKPLLITRDDVPTTEPQG